MDPRAEFFDQQANTWEEQCYPAPVRARLASLVESFHLRPGTQVLDMGTGTGILHPYLLEAVGTIGRIAVCDLSFQMLKEARKKPYAPQILCFQASAMELPLPSGSFDQVICFAAFPHFAHKLRAMQEMARVTKTGGELVIAHLLSREGLLQHHKTHPAVAQDCLPEADDMRRLFREAGFTTPDIRNEPGLYFASAVKR